MNYVALQDKLGSFLHTGPLRWDMSLCLLAGLDKSCSVTVQRVLRVRKGRVLYRSIPYAVLIILLIRGVTLPGCGNGLEFYLTPNVTKLSESGVWKDAAVQIFFSLSSSWGGLITLASYNRLKTDCIRDGMLISICNCATSVFAGFVVFSFLGYLARSSTPMPVNVHPGGLQLLTVFDDYSGAWNVMVITILECVCIGYVYGVRRFVKDEQHGRANDWSGYCWLPAMALLFAGVMACWCFLTPVIVGITLVFSWVKFEAFKIRWRAAAAGSSGVRLDSHTGSSDRLFAWSAASVWQMRSDRWTANQAHQILGTGIGSIPA
uniref:Sodium-and chloride-dependent glycine transporter 2 n=1 Tax=Macrostomum lignano TaxID=282301 RepID=A0A1I8JPX1_9PLAT